MLSIRDLNDSQMLEMAEQSTCSTPVASGVAVPLSHHLDTSLSKRRNRSAAWEHFIPEPGSEKKAKCKYCGSLIKYADGTSSMNTHLTRCKSNPNKDGNNPNKESNKRQRMLPSSSQGEEGQLGSCVGSSLTYFKFDQHMCQDELVKMFVVAELPFRFVEHDAFCRFLSILQPRFIVPSRSALVHDIWTLFNEEKEKLKKHMCKYGQRICLTIDMWTSIQNLKYMSLTAHFVDDNWKLQKRILNFCQVASHVGKIMAKTVEMCLNGWELNRVFSLTVDTASSNDLEIQYLKKKIMSWNCVVLKGDYIHMRSCANILALIVKDGLREISDSILRIRNAVKYVRSSPSRLAKFKACAEEEKGVPSVDDETRWNSTYLMLEAAVNYQQAFELLERQESKYVKQLVREKGVPSVDDWDYVRSVLPFLKMFYDCTLRISCTSNITSNMYMKEVFAIGRKIRQYYDDNDVSIRLMAIRMKTKFDKYWGNPNTVNILLLIAIVLDPRHKLDYVNWSLDNYFDSEKANELKNKLYSCLRSLYDQYQGVEEGSQTQVEETQIDDEDDDFYSMNLYRQSTGRKFDAKSELEKYLKEDCEPYKKSVELDVLGWWKVNSIRFPILASMAQEVLAIPVSTVDLESAFNIGGMVLDSYHSSLTPKMLEALVCTQDWLKRMPFSLLSPEDFEELERFEQEVVAHLEVAPSAAISLDGSNETHNV